MKRSRFGGSTVLCVLATLALSEASNAAVVDPRPLSLAESAAVGLAAAYLESGPSSWWDSLDEASPLRYLGRQAALAEIEVRAGPRQASTWELQAVVEDGFEGVAVFAIELASGFRETLLLELVLSGPEWKIHGVRSLVDLSDSPESRNSETERPQTEPAGESRGETAVGALPHLALGATGLLALAGVVLVWRRRALGVAFILAAGMAAATTWSLRLSDGEGRAGIGVTVEAGGAFGRERLGELLELRRLLATAPIDPRLEAILSESRAGSRLREVGTLWSAELALHSGDLDGAESWLRALPVPSSRPLADLLWARVALLRGDGVTTAIAYERALEAFPSYEGMLIEAADALALMGFEARAKGVLKDLAARGTRIARVHYELARYAVFEGEEELAARYLRAAWELEPLERGEVLEDWILARLVRAIGLFDYLALGDAQQPAAQRPPASTSAPGPLAEAFSVYRGKLLEAKFRGGSTLVIPAGVNLAPPDAVAESAEDFRRREEERILTELGKLKRAAEGTGAMILPRAREEIAVAARALARRNRWSDVLDLTVGLAARPQQMPTELAILRAEALSRMHLSDQATAFLVRVAGSRASQERKDPKALYALGMRLISGEQYQQAAQVIRMAEKNSRELPILSLLPRVHLEARLDRSFLTHRSDSFQIRYPFQTEDYFVGKLAEVLEAELLRLQHWIPWKPIERIEVRLYSFEDFFEAFAPNREIMGLFDGKVRVPLADLPTLHPVVMSILTHEVAHAMISGATTDQAPRWFHEGLAQHVQPVQEQINPVASYRRMGTFLSFPLLDSALSAYGDPYLSRLAYDEALWVVHYLEARHGSRAIRELLGAFRRGLTTEEALKEVLGLSLVEFDAAVWKWCIEEAPAAWPTRTVRYDLGSQEGLRLSKEAGR